MYKSINGRRLLRNIDFDNVHFDEYSLSDARAALFLLSTGGSTTAQTNTRANFSTGYYINNNEGSYKSAIIPYVTSGSLVNVSNRNVIGFVFAKMTAFTGNGGNDNEIDIEVKINNNTYSFGKISTYQKTNANTVGNNIAAQALLLPGDSLTLHVNKGYFNNLSEAQLSFIEFKSSRNGINDIVIV